MRNNSVRFLITVWIMLAFSVQGQKPLRDTIDLMPGIEVSVMLKDDLKAVKLPAYCGLRPAYMVFTYTVILVTSGTYSAKTIRINIQCPRDLVETKSLSNGKVYRYKLKPSAVQTGLHPNSGQVIYEIVTEVKN